MSRRKSDQDVFGSRMAAWQAYRRTPWGRLRYSVVAHTLDVVIGARTDLRVLDVGGGDGVDALHLAARGHQVTIADPSALMLEQAGVAAAEQGLADRITLLPVGIDKLAGKGLIDFDLVLCHNVLQYVADVRRSVGAVVAAAAPAALVSLICPNPPAEVMTALIRGGRPAAALADLDEPHSRTVTFDEQVARVPVEVAERALMGSGCELLHRFGIRCVVDLVPDDEAKTDPAWFAELEALELALCDREPYLRVARLWQLVGRTF